MASGRRHRQCSEKAIEAIDIPTEVEGKEAHGPYHQEGARWMCSCLSSVIRLNVWLFGCRIGGFITQTIKKVVP